ncbi:hypothetical protein [Streptomyces sp. 5-10]|uniref:hypothetical protein n=1 Tax=Streptomyces sp. 5-10 TaxID=878925 RepID=UPI00168B2A37|nr:hypothetical protein [Streptomyces sp. 5-10]MBD3004678.1 hypothetical protein [Streptomyces sp. 5-10]
MKRTVHDNHRIEVHLNLRHPRGLRPGDEGYNEHAQRVCGEVERAIRRHVDNLAPASLGDSRPAPGAVRIIFDTREECSHCGLLWETVTEADLDEHSVLGEPLCCRKAVVEFRNEKGIPLGEFGEG